MGLSGRYDYCVFTLAFVLEDKMATTSFKYDSFNQYLPTGVLDLDTQTLRVALLLNTYTYSAAHTVWADVSGAEVSNGSGYATNGMALTSVAVTGTGSSRKLTADNPVWTNLTKTFRYAVIYADATVGSVVKPLIGVILLDNTPADIVVSATDYSIQWHAGGVITFT